MRDSEGVEVAAVRGVLASILKMMEDGATHIGVATDHVIESFRNRMWPGYKTGAGIEPEFIAGPLPSGPNLLHFRVSVSQRAFAIPIDIDPNKERQSRLDIDIDNTPGKDSC